MENNLYVKPHVIEAYTDGSALIKGNHYESSSAALICIDDEPTYSVGMYHPGGTNSLGEIWAVYLALEGIHNLMLENKELSNLKEIVVYLDSEYVFKSLTSYIYKWKQVGYDDDDLWVAHGSGKPVAWQWIFKSIYRRFLSKDRRIETKIKFRHINSHVTDKVKARYHYMNINQIDISMSEFEKHLSRNDSVDHLADDIRIQKKFLYQEGGLWCKNENPDIFTIDGKALMIPKLGFASHEKRN